MFVKRHAALNGQRPVRPPIAGHCDATRKSLDSCGARGVRHRLLRISHSRELRDRCHLAEALKPLPGMETQNGKNGIRSRILPMAAFVLGWGWALLAGGGGIYLLLTKGPWPLTNGWYALASGISACPSTGWLLNRFAGIKISGWAQFAVALFFFLAGHVALTLGV